MRLTKFIVGLLVKFFFIYPCGMEGCLVSARSLGCLIGCRQNERRVSKLRRKYCLIKADSRLPLSQLISNRTRNRHTLVILSPFDHV